MRSIARVATVLAAALIVCGGGTAGAAGVDVRVPFPFVVQGHQFPAGQYRLESEEGDSSVMLIRGEKGNTASMFVMTTTAGGKDPAGGRPALIFNRDERQYRLADIWESAGQGREVAAGR
jgi:hypothetical protein